MRLNNYDISNIMKGFPRIKLSYVKTIHKKVCSANMYYLIPKGKKYFVWFRYFKNREVCLFLEISKDNSIKNITIKNCCFKSDICFKTGTIMYGTLIKKSNINFFSVEDIFYYKNNNLSEKNLQYKLKILGDIFDNKIKQICISKFDVVLGLPIMTIARDLMDKYINNPPYQIYSVQHRYNNNTTTFFNEKITNYSNVFLVKPSITPDIYNLYLKDNLNNLIFYKNALIPDYKKSVFMNSIFRNIKENNNLDLLEESDDEEDFQDIREDKYIKIKEAIMICDYKSKLNMWVPREITELNIDNLKTILNIEKNIN